MDRKSKITKKSDIDYSKTIVLSKLQGTQQHFDQEKKRFMETYKAQMESGALTEQKVNEIINNMFIQRNVVEAIKQHIRQSFEEMYDNGELTELVETIKKQNTGIPEDIATKIAQNIIFDTLLWEYLGEEWRIEATDEDVNNVLDEHYKQTNQSIREFKTNPDKFEGMRKQVRLQKIINELPKKFKVKFELELTKPQAENK